MRKLTIPQAAEELKTTKEQVWRMIAEGTLQFETVDNTLFVILPDKSADDKKPRRKKKDAQAG